MASPAESAWEAIWIGDENTTEDQGWIPCQWDATYNELSVFEGKVTFGAITNDSDDIVSSLVISDLTGGGQIDMMTGADQTRFRHGIIDARAPGTITLPQYVEELPIPAGATGTTYPAYYIGDTVLGIWGTKIYAWDNDAASWSAGVTILEPSAKPTMFDNKVFIPNGTSGYTLVSNDTPTVAPYAGVNNPALSTDTDSPNVIDFEVWDHKLWAITPTGTPAYSFTGADDAWAWDQGYNTAKTRWIGFDDSRPPVKIFTYSDNNGDPLLHAATNRAVYRLDVTLQQWEMTNIQFAPHPNFARAVAVWRPGEDLHIGVGLEKITYTAANVIVPDQGLSRNDGMPFSNLGTISDLEPETSRLFACVSGSEFGTTEVTFDSKFGTAGSGDTNFNNPSQIARDGSGNIYVADYGNGRVKKFDSSGTFVAQSASGFTQITGVAVDPSGNVYINSQRVAGPVIYSIWKLPSTLASFTNIEDTGSTVPQHMATDGTNVYSIVGNAVYKITVSGTTLTGWGTAGSGDGQFDTPVGVATDGTYVYVVDQENQRVQKFTTSGTFVAKWGTSGSGNGQFQTPTAIALHPVTGNVFVADSGRNDVQEFNNNGTYLATHGEAGTGDGQFTDPSGIVFNAAGTQMYVSDSSANRVQIFDLTTATREFPAVPSIQDWNGLGWFGSWELTDSPNEQLTWGCIVATSHPTEGYAYWFGCTDGKLRRIPLRRTFHNPRAGWQAGYDRFAATGYLLTSRFNALMAGFYKKAHRLVVYMDNATPTEKVTVKYRVDIEDDNWITLGEVTQTGRTILPFGVDGDGFSWGKRFNWIQFQFDFERGSDEFQTPVMQAAVLNYSKIPQQARSFTFHIPYPKRQWLQKTGKEIETHLSSMLAASSLLKLVHRDTTYRGTLAAVAGTTSLGKNDAGGATLNFLEIREQD